MARKKGIHPVWIAGGVVVIVMAFLLFTPAILGSAAASGDLEKYNGSSQQGNDTVKTASVINGFLVGMTGIPLVVAAFVVAIIAFLVVIIWAYRGR